MLHTLKVETHILDHFYQHTIFLKMEILIFELLKNIKQFPNVEFFEEPFEGAEQASKNWLIAQKND